MQDTPEGARLCPGVGAAEKAHLLGAPLGVEPGACSSSDRFPGGGVRSPSPSDFLFWSLLQLLPPPAAVWTKIQGRVSAALLRSSVT